MHKKAPQGKEEGNLAALKHSPQREIMFFRELLQLLDPWAENDSKKDPTFSDGVIWAKKTAQGKEEGNLAL